MSEPRREHLELTVPDDDRIPRHPRYRLVPDSPRRGCSVLGFLLLAVLVGSSIAAPSSAVAPVVKAQPFGASSDAAPRLSGAPRPARFPEHSGSTDSDVGGAPQPTPALITAPSERPYQSATGTALFSTSATWCAPTPRQCRRWGGTARLAALPTYSGTPYVVRVWYDSRHVDVTVVSICGCGIDLSPYAFEQLAPLSRGRINVEVEGPIAPLPNTSTKGTP